MGNNKYSHKEIVEMFSDFTDSKNTKEMLEEKYNTKFENIRYHLKKAMKRKTKILYTPDKIKRVKFRDYLNKNQISLTQLAKDAGIHYATLHRYIEGKDITNKKLEILSRYTKLSIDQLRKMD